MVANYERKGNNITSVTFEDTLADEYTKKIESRYGSLFKSLDVTVGFAQFLRILMKYEDLNPIPKSQMLQILPSTSTNESLRLSIRNEGVKE